MFQQGPHERVGGCSTDQTADNTGASALSTSCSPCPGDYYVPSLAIGPGSLSLSYPCGDRSLIHWCSQSSSVFVYNTRGERFDASSAMLPAFVRAEQDNGLVPYLRAQPSFTHILVHLFRMCKRPPGPCSKQGTALSSQSSQRGWDFPCQMLNLM